MFRLKTLSVLAGLIAVLAVSAAPASAWWESNGTETKGKATVTESGAFVDKAGTVTAEVKCPPNEIEGKWSIQTKGEIKIHLKEEKQLETKFGPHLHLNVTNWGKNCVASIGTTKFKAGEVKISPCELQLVQEKGVFTATAGVVTACRIEVAICTIIVPAGMEKQQGSNEGINVGLKEVKLENSGSNQIDKANVTGVRAEKQANALCPLATVGAASLTGFVFTVEGAKAV
ncbi:MAG TPA: hypothetical protein VGY76_08390 [Solirubrobacteraceae bacterium]|jgi:hypothetical protein|nr:hypothetical protein [Solirubrobacteraceae bacterium]